MFYSNTVSSLINKFIKSFFKTLMDLKTNKKGYYKKFD